MSADLSALGLAVGHATGTRELHTASPFHLVDRTDAVLLTGESAYGLADDAPSR